MSGVDRHTGKVIDNFTSALQSVEVIFTTRIGERLMRRHFGAGLVELLGRATTPALFAAWKTLIAVGIDLWEPRLRVRAVLISGAVDELRVGQAGINVLVDWRPRALAGDPSVADTRSFTIRLGERITIK